MKATDEKSWPFVCLTITLRKIMENHRPLPRLPLELFEKIVGKTEVATKFNAAFSCRQMLNLLRADLPHINCLSVLFDPDACDGVVLWVPKLSFLFNFDGFYNLYCRFKDVNNTSAVVCQCEEHVDRQRVFLEEVLGACCGQVTSVTIDDLLANRVRFLRLIHF